MVVMVPSKKLAKFISHLHQTLALGTVRVDDFEVIKVRFLSRFSSDFVIRIGLESCPTLTVPIMMPSFCNDYQARSRRAIP